DQTVFTPAKSKHIDGVPYGQQIVTVSIGYYDIEGNLRTPVFLFKDRKHRAMYRRWIGRLIENRGKIHALVGQNIKFDLLYLLKNDPLLRSIMSPDKLIVDDTIIKTFLLDENQTERGLKEISMLFGLANYQGLKVTGKHGNATSSSDPNLLYYNCYDSAVTLKLDSEMDRRIVQRYGGDTNKVGPICADMRNRIIWNTVCMERAGCTMDIPKLRGVDLKYKKAREEPIAFAEERGITICGEGSQKSLNELFTRLVTDANLLDDTRLELTKAKKEISIGVNNRKLLLVELPEGDDKEMITQFSTFKEFDHLRNTYSNKLLTSTREGILYRSRDRGFIFPEWYPIPTVFNKGSRDNVAAKDKEKQGGTKQGRITSRKPPSQTFPAEVKQCFMSRFPGGELLEYDLNRIELVVAALFSGDPPLIDDLCNSNPHLETAKSIWPDISPDADDWKSSGRYALGKELNFLVIFRGGPHAYIN
ncbi:hypothetical protein LCGC14_2566210, partial [marine sediment metagenome]